ncbi:lantibiotic dehydratase C-terminal domain-containing protein [Arthrobacter sp. H5]|uniref:lantibiotic dehydratase C-terminal domain-containing protein n=1 Tax=Arthrobacter sp. H5 TaxID=1267973 RepID=UPI00138AF247|nr:lantibiotic dehydratase C-terminal domain-containing protein [Arthrobacter sp. H5]
MSQLTAVRTASRTANSTQWWHISVFTGGFDVADGIIGELVTPLAAQAQVLGAERWFFTRCAEPSFPHVRMHVLAQQAVLDRLQAFHRALQAQAGDILPQLTVRQHFSAPASGRHYFGGAGETDPQLESDLVKYGGIEGLQLAEEVFELSSELAAWANQRFVKMHNRSAFASLLLFDSARSMMKGPRSAGWADRRRISWEFYWDTHLKTCTADLGPRSAGVRDAMTAQVSAKIPAFHSLMSATAAESAVHNWRRRWFRAIDTYLYRADRVRVSRSAQHLTVYQAHMMLNRLGFTPREEAALGLYARSWSVDREKAAFQQN